MQDRPAGLENERGITIDQRPSSYVARVNQQADACLDGQRYRGCPVLKLGRLQNYYYLMSKMDRGLRRCTGFTTRRCLVCHFAAVAADEFKACA